MTALDWIVAYLLIGVLVSLNMMPKIRAEIQEFFGEVDEPTFVLSWIATIILWPAALWSRHHG